MRGDRTGVRMPASEEGTHGAAQDQAGSGGDALAPEDLRDLAAGLLPILDSEPAIQDSLPKLGEALGRGLAASVVALWMRDRRVDRLLCAGVWARTPPEAKKFERASSECALSEGEGLPGRAWRSRVPVWLTAPADDARMATLPARAGGPHAYAFPLMADAGLVGVVEVVGDAAHDTDVALNRALVSIGAELGQALDRRMAEQDAGIERARLEVALASGRMGVWDWDLDTNRLRWSDTLEAIFGLALGGFEGTVDAYIERTHPDDRAWVLESYLQQFERRGDDHIHLEHRFVRADGAIGWLQVRGRAIARPGGELASMTGVAIDITNRIEREQAARSQRAQLDLAAEVAGVGTWSWDTRRGVALWSDELVAMAGLEPVAQELTAEQIRGILHADDSGLADRIAEAATSGLDFHERYRIVRADGVPRWFESWGRPLHDVSGELVGIAGITLDVTDAAGAADPGDEQE